MCGQHHRRRAVVLELGDLAALSAFEPHAELERRTLIEGGAGDSSRRSNKLKVSGGFFIHVRQGHRDLLRVGSAVAVGHLLGDLIAGGGAISGRGWNSGRGRTGFGCQ